MSQKRKIQKVGLWQARGMRKCCTNKSRPREMMENWDTASSIIGVEKVHESASSMRSNGYWEVCYNMMIWEYQAKVERKNSEIWQIHIRLQITTNAGENSHTITLGGIGSAAMADFKIKRAKKKRRISIKSRRNPPKKGKTRLKIKGRKGIGWISRIVASLKICSSVRVCSKKDCSSAEGFSRRQLGSLWVKST